MKHSSSSHPALRITVVHVDTTHGRSRTRKSSTVLLRIALALFAIGLVAIVAILLFPIFSDSKPPLSLYLTAMFSAPAGFVLALVYALASGRRAR